jgi:hypothetical protein
MIVLVIGVGVLSLTKFTSCWYLDLYRGFLGRGYYDDLVIFFSCWYFVFVHLWYIAQLSDSHRIYPYDNWIDLIIFPTIFPQNYSLYLAFDADLWIFSSISYTNFIPFFVIYHCGLDPVSTPESNFRSELIWLIPGKLSVIWNARVRGN